ncbi:MAG: ribosomal-protein-alanine acetyltransferase [Porticoccaceae bacterium]|nr:MAG: ribosomal-protein-alanine acetyltransferase [Porticoccaceae bacterium]
MTRLRRARASDAATLARLEAAATAHPWSERLWAESIRQHQCWLAEEAGESMGAIVWREVCDEAELLNLVVAPARQGRGLGGRLLGHLLSAIGPERNLFLEVRAGNLPALRLYRRFGLVELGRRAGYYPGAQGREDAILMGRFVREPGTP